MVKSFGYNKTEWNRIKKLPFYHNSTENIYYEGSLRYILRNNEIISWDVTYSHDIYGKNVPASRIPFGL